MIMIHEIQHALIRKIGLVKPEDIIMTITNINRSDQTIIDLQINQSLKQI